MVVAFDAVLHVVSLPLRWPHRDLVTWCFLMVVKRISCLFRGRDGCNNGGGKGAH